MKAETLKALKASIRKWAKRESGIFVEPKSKNCPLCKLYYNNPNCRGCPIAEFTGFDSCIGTPVDAYGRLGAFGASPKVLSSVARDMRIFLEALLPKTERRG